MRITQLDQNHLNLQIIKFMAFDAQSPTDTYGDIAARKSRATTIEQGLCHGHSIVDSYMHATKHFEWWLALKQELSRWDDRKESLNKAVKLPGSHSKEPVTLHQLFKRATSYLLLGQAWNTTEIAELQQVDILRPGNPFFSTMHGPIVAECTAVGNLSRRHCIDLLTKHQAIFTHGAVCLLRFKTHTCTFAVDSEGKWIFRDPNDSSGGQRFSSLDSMMNYLFNDMCFFYSNEFSIQVATWDKSKVQAVSDFSKDFNLILEKDAIRLIEGSGLWQMASSNPSALKKVMIMAKTDRKLAIKLEGVLQSIGSDGWECISAVLYYMPEIISGLISLAGNDLLFRHRFFEALIRPNSCGYREIHKVFERSSSVEVQKVFQLARQYQGLQDLLCGVLLVEDHKKCNLILLTIRHATAALSVLIDIANTNPAFLEKFSVGFQRAMIADPQAIKQVFSKEHAKVAAKLVYLASQSMEIQKMLLRMVIVSAQSTPPLFHMAEHAQLFKRILSFQSGNGESLLVEKIQSAPTRSSECACVLRLITDGSTGLHFLATHNPGLVVELCEVSNNTRHHALKKALQDNLDVGNKDGVTPREMLKKVLSEAAFGKLLKKTEPEVKAKRKYSPKKKSTSQRGGMWKTVVYSPNNNRRCNNARETVSIACGNRR